jgi:hypothetical protein
LLEEASEDLGLLEEASEDLGLLRASQFEFCERVSSISDASSVGIACDCFSTTYFRVRFSLSI